MPSFAPSYQLEAIPIRLEAIALRLEAMAIRLEKALLCEPNFATPRARFAIWTLSAQAARAWADTEALKGAVA